MRVINVGMSVLGGITMWFLKSIHVFTVILSGGLFVLRGWWQWTSSPQRDRRWVRILPHTNDTLLLVSALLLAWRIQQYPFVDTWLTAKVVALVAYIALGMIAMHYGRTRGQRALAWCTAVGVYVYIVGVAISKSPAW
ncbi:MAG: SirB2 family protein [Gammaproteobacteria bacterium]|nr:SirB2 family protein [Gammaproteobacteria bacterium]